MYFAFLLDQGGRDIGRIRGCDADPIEAVFDMLAIIERRGWARMAEQIHEMWGNAVLVKR